MSFASENRYHIESIHVVHPTLLSNKSLYAIISCSFFAVFATFLIFPISLCSARNWKREVTTSEESSSFAMNGMNDNLSNFVHLHYFQNLATNTFMRSCPPVPTKIYTSHRPKGWNMFYLKYLALSM